MERGEADGAADLMIEVVHRLIEVVPISGGALRSRVAL